MSRRRAVPKAEAHKAPRVAIATLDIQTLVDDYVSKGIPVVLSGFNASADHAKWERQKAAAAAAMYVCMADGVEYYCRGLSRAEGITASQRALSSKQAPHSATHTRWT